MFAIQAIIGMTHKFLKAKTKCVIIARSKKAERLQVVAINLEGIRTIAWVGSSYLTDFSPYLIEDKLQYIYCFKTQKQAQKVCNYLQKTFADVSEPFEDNIND